MLDTQCVSKRKLVNKTKDLRLRVEPELYESFREACYQLDLSASHVLRRLMQQFVEKVPPNQEAFWLSGGTVSDRDLQ